MVSVDDVSYLDKKLYQDQQFWLSSLLSIGNILWENVEAQNFPFFSLKALVNIVFDRFKKVKTVLADLYNYVHVGE